MTKNKFKFNALFLLSIFFPITILATDHNLFWIEILTMLNQSDIKNDQSLIDDDLFLLNKSELKKIEENWLFKTKSSPSAFNNLQQKNSFFHQEINKLNNQILFNHQQLPSLKLKLNQISNKAFEMVKKNPVTAIENSDQYERGNEVGFCFGRALYVHYLLRQISVPNKYIRKIFALGDLFVNKRIWRFHVATMIYHPEHSYLVIDPMLNEVLPLNKWIQIISNFDIKKGYSRIRFYITDPRKFLPASGPYDIEQLKLQHLKVYFDLLLESIKNVTKA